MKKFDIIYKYALEKAEKMGENYITLLKMERKEIEKQGAEQYWTDLLASKKKFKTNKNGLIFPFLIGLTDVDPILEYGNKLSSRYEGKLDVDNDPGAFKDKDMPDIDLDFIPDAKDVIFDYAIEKYGSDKVCSVGLWQTYLPRSALKDVAKSLGYRDKLLVIEKITKSLPDEFDQASLKDALEDYDDFNEWYNVDNTNKEIAKYAFRLVGKIKTQGKHAGGLIISSVPLSRYLPIAKIGQKGKEKWTSEWTEGTNVQLSKFGFVKYDILGLKTLQYIYEACLLIKQNHDIELNWDEMGIEDADSFETANLLKTDSIFQFDTDVAKGILSKGGVKKFTDIMVYTSLGRPGPMPMVDEYIKRRDSKNKDWHDEEHPKVLALLHDTLGITVFQEQVSSLLINLAGFTIPEADKARKIMSKKWKDQMTWVRNKILTGMTQSLTGKCNLKEPDLNGDEERIQAAKEVNEICGTTDWTWAKEYWKRLETFARYSFNKAHALSYALQCYRCLYLKTHFPSEWWCACLNTCVTNKQPKYMRIARSEGVNFGTIDINNMSKKFDVIDGQITPGLLGIKGVGEGITDKLDVDIHDIVDIDDFVERQIKNSTLMERAIHLGAFDKLHKNRKALWYWYQYKYGTTDEAKEIRKVLNKKFEPTPEEIEEIREQMYKEHIIKHPKSKKIPKRIQNFKPKIKPDREQVMACIEKDYSYEELLDFQIKFLGYHWDSPMEIYGYKGGHGIENAKINGVLECVVSTVDKRRTANGKEFLTLAVTDGIDIAKIQIWGNDIRTYGEEFFSEGSGLCLKVSYNEEYKSFNLKRHEKINELPKRSELDKLSEYMSNSEIFPEDVELEDDDYLALIE
jgi:DNA polymerase III alpha subunit